MRHVRTLYFCIIPVVNKSLSIEVPYTGGFCQHNAAKNNKHDITHEQVTNNNESVTVISKDCLPNAGAEIAHKATSHSPPLSQTVTTD